MNRIAYVSTYIPQKCGLATYTHHLRQSVRAARGWRGIDPVIAVTSVGELVAYEDPALRVFPKEERSAYRAMAEKINRSDVSVVSLQHEFGIFGGEAGAYILDFVRHLQKPLVTTFHTVFENPEEPYRSIQQQIAQRSDRIVVMNRKGIGYLHKCYHIPKDRIVYIPHGTPVPAPENRDAYRKKLGWSDRLVLLTFGLLSRGKGLETVIRSLPAVVRSVPNVLYVIVGQTHPEVRKREGESYREELQHKIKEHGLQDHVRMVNHYAEEMELVEYLTACDLYVTPYPGMQQITSGTLAYAVGLGRPVLSTPYSYAQDLLGDYPELLLPAGDSSEWGKRIISMLSEPDELKKWEKIISRIGQPMHWPEVGKAHARLFDELAGSRTAHSDQAAGVKPGGRMVAP
jgi:glycosyltransferase involved in cell wall biosynthesis